MLILIDNKSSNILTTDTIFSKISKFGFQINGERSNITKSLSCQLGLVFVGLKMFSEFFYLIIKFIEGIIKVCGNS
jgi:hypothetical protein